ncbi:5-(carboxyamino)imidazole ribonucleotide synthase [Palleronia marisminoris]|uniref:N5-carboxyaminoimidazole ribonucleotide synthase n=1 Tax=Palleronia marisminoris TaxID=315423 RepID=A0A1Y5RY09_9RHOB|nr:5-(carboxyamino)imidazole ribonucleotide synthase [Palleronia marisminoris]SFG41934.1 5-(carboxyamino)imidazole ribonucleotide synthase [Palleronia marisminoris]SLN27836.1 N5-carboxyaminoimidazole ribonucleotide synthase [Palleronia marisminoris]
MTEPLPPGSTIGILGGGQLGRMLAVAAGRLGLRVHIFEPSETPPAAEVACHHTAAAFTDEAALISFAQGVDVVTYEFENIPTAALDILEAHRPIRPNREALRVSQDRLTEKTWLSELGLAVAPFADIADAAALGDALDRIGTPAILKTRRFGYDGKGQARIADATAAEQALASLEGAPAILEGFVPFTKEISVIGARGLDGRVACFDPGENVHEDGILRRTTVPAGVSHALATDAVLIASRILTALDYVGVLGVELFVTDGGLIVNEIAPRVHNSGHWTQNGCVIDQFEQHVRAVAGWPLGDGKRHSDTQMENLIGDDVDRIPQIGAEPGAALHLYGKAETRPGRKMGHVNRLR